VSTVGLIQQLVTRRAEKRPDALAVVCAEESLTYGRLEELANRMAWALDSVGCRSLDRAALLTRKSPRTIVALLGTLKSGGIVVPLDAGSPAPRLAKIVRSCGARVLLVDDGGEERLAELRRAGALVGVRVGWLGARAPVGDAGFDFAWDDLSDQPAAPPPASSARTDDPAQILHTSGSTGDPKGVVVRHSSILQFVSWAVRHFGIAPYERISSHSPLHFDLSTFDLFGAFAAGAELHLLAPELSLLPHRLADRIRALGLTQWFSVPSLLTYLASFDVVRQDDFPELKRLIWCGEVFPTPALRYWMTRLPHVRFTNLYGPTETTIASSYYDVPAVPKDDREAIPIGAPCDGEELLVLDEALRPVAPESVGELYIRGAGLSPGYWNDFERTRAAFVADPFSADPSARVYRTGDLARVGPDGLVRLVGRRDSQIKSRGYRIELGEIETAIAATGLTQEAVVTAVPTSGFEGLQICCAYAPAASRTATPVDLRRELGRVLPGYMIPARWLALERLPRNGSGKLDRRRVKESFELAPGLEPPIAATPTHGPAPARPTVCV
jgi:amino acid adenylation domain-containing protein